jgi:hypothetical protein
MRVRNCTQRPRENDRIDTPVVEWKRLRGLAEKLDGEGKGANLPTSHVEKLRRGINPANVGNLAAIKRQVEARADPDIKHTAASARDVTRSAIAGSPVLHREIDQMGQNIFGIDTHEFKLPV